MAARVIGEIASPDKEIWNDDLGSRMLRPYQLSKKWIKAFFARTDLKFPVKVGPCLVLGSAPTSSLPANFDSSWMFWSVNASQVAAEKWGIGKPHVTIMSAHMLGHSAVNIEGKHALRNGSTGLLVLTADDMERVNLTQHRLREINYNYESIIVLSPAQRAKIARRAAGTHIMLLGGERKSSTGIFAAALALYLGNKPVVLSGFSLSEGGHAYSASAHPRKHVAADKFALGRLVSNNSELSTSDAAFSIESGLALHRN